MVFYEDREEAYYRPPTPKIEAVPTPQFVEPDITWGNIPKPKPPGYTMTRDEAIRRGLYTPTLPAGKYYEPVENISTRFGRGTPIRQAQYATEPYRPYPGITFTDIMNFMYKGAPGWFRSGADISRAMIENLFGGTSPFTIPTPRETYQPGFPISYGGRLGMGYGPAFDLGKYAPPIGELNIPEREGEQEQPTPQITYSYPIGDGRQIINIGGGTPGSRAGSSGSYLINWRV
jgi:hypothetical protein